MSISNDDAAEIVARLRERSFEHGCEAGVLDRRLVDLDDAVNAVRERIENNFAPIEK